MMPGKKKDMQEIAFRYNELLRSCSPFATKEEAGLIHEAFDFAAAALNEKKTDYGEMQISHCLKVATLASDDTGLGPYSIIGALLHNVFLTTGVSRETIRERFGPVVLSLVDGYAKISSLPTGKVSIQSEKFRKLFLTVVEDIRIILLKVAHRLFDMRILERLPEAKQEKVSNEVEYLYIPICHRLGLYNVKTELEDILMRHRQRDIYEFINENLTATRAKRDVYIREFSEPLARELMKQNIPCDIVGRSKSIPSIWEKMKKQDVSLNEVYDLFAIRIIARCKPEEEKAICWKIYSIVTNIYPPNPKRLRDWITTPKASGYESLHTTVKDPTNKWVEIQIRSERMNEIAEKGQAAHWRYKGFDRKELTDEWLNQVRDIIENPGQIKFDDAPTKKNRPQKVYAFTPTGDLKELQAGATVLDFAYEIHTRVGDSCSGAKVNNILVPIRQALHNGDRVEIITSKNQRPKQDWLMFVKTPKARNKIKRSLKEEKFRQAETGSEVLKRRLKNWKIPYEDRLINHLVKHYKCSSPVDLYSLIAEERIDLNEIKNLLLAKDRMKGKKSDVTREKTVGEPSAKDTPSQDILVIDRNLDNVNYHLAKCCNPLPGDPVFGFVTIGKGITIHRKTCPNARRLLEKYGYRRIHVQWKKSEGIPSFQTTIKITGEDRIGILGEITGIISNDMQVNILSVKVDSRKDVFSGELKLNVIDNKHLGELLHKISRVKGVTKASRLGTRGVK